MTDPDELSWPFNEQSRLRKSLAEISRAQVKSAFDISMVTRNMANENQSNSNSSKAEECCSILSSSPLAGCSPRPHEDHSQGGDKVS